MRPSDLTGLADQLDRTAALLRTRGPDAIRISRDAQDGLRSGASATSGGQTPDPTAHQALAPTDEARQYDQLRAAARALEAAAADTAGLIHSITKAVQEHETNPPKVPLCENCGGMALPRRIKGRCAACYEHWRRHGRDRHIDTTTSKGNP